MAQFLKAIGNITQPTVRAPLNNPAVTHTKVNGAIICSMVKAATRTSKESMKAYGVRAKNTAGAKNGGQMNLNLKETSFTDRSMVLVVTTGVTVPISKETGRTTNKTDLACLDGVMDELISANSGRGRSTGWDTIIRLMELITKEIST